MVVLRKHLERHAGLKHTALTPGEDRHQSIMDVRLRGVHVRGMGLSRNDRMDNERSRVVGALAGRHGPRSALPVRQLAHPDMTFGTSPFR